MGGALLSDVLLHRFHSGAALLSLKLCFGLGFDVLGLQWNTPSWQG
jgi:hypothetical protein